MSTNRLRAHLAAGGSAVGGWCSSGSPAMAETLAVAGFDYVCVDAQHGFVGSDSLLPCLYAIARTGATPVVRVPSADAAWIGRALDAGAEAVIVPMVDDADTAARAVAACRYAPEGTRSYGPIRARLFLNEAPPDEVNRQVQCFVMVESASAVERVDDIAGVSGVDGIYVGPADLAVSMGLLPGSRDAGLEAAIERVRGACAAAGVVAAIHATDGAEARRRLDQGFAMATCGTDLGLFRTCVADQLKTAR